ncbi:MAG: amidohydrolase family protein [Pseudomonadales bacterium]|uniref:amidohydrolase family protein n=1 Tax=Alcanivorax sp. TaxID=1872427 RepID=UPI003C332B6D
MNNPTPGSDEWLDQVKEDIVDPDRPIIDPHHHLWQERRGRNYLLEDLWADTGSGHNIVKTVFIECRAQYRDDGPEHMRCLGETEFVLDQARKSEADPNQATIAGIVGKVDLTLGEDAREVLEAHVELGDGRFRGIRHAGSRAEHPEELFIAGDNLEGLYLRNDFQTGINVLGSMGLTYDTWHYHYQNRDFLELARACPDTVMILDHFGTPLGVGRYASRKEEIYEQWQKDIAALADCDNVVAKLGGLAMPDNGFGWDKRATPATSDEFCEAQKPYYMHTIECFGPDRCMTESNFPVDMYSISYHVLYNGLKKILADFSEDEKHAMFYGTAARVYSLD